jgi:site-specific DNA recombinase
MPNRSRDSAPVRAGVYTRISWGTRAARGPRARGLHRPGGAHGLRVAVVAGGDYDLTTPDGRFTARIVGAVARKESEDRSRRVRRKHLELAERGNPSGQLGWGVRDDAERELVREAARRVLAGQGPMTIARDWNVRVPLLSVAHLDRSG